MIDLWMVAVPAGAASVLWVVRYVTKAIAAQVVEQLGDSLQTRWKHDIDVATDPIFEELSYNGGTSLKDMVRRIERQLEQVLGE